MKILLILAGLLLATTLSNSVKDEHDSCIATWESLGKQEDSEGCVREDILDDFTKHCPLPELREAMKELKSNCDSETGKPFLSVIRDSTSARDYQTRNSSLLSRSRRMVLSGEQDIWPGGKVPYIDGEGQSTRRAMNTVERFTCIRFYPWSNNDGVTTNDELGLDHQSYLKFVYEGGCWADHGNTRNTDGQKVSCCGGITCLHEVGHALGAYHEHQNPLGEGTIRLNPQNAEESKVFNFKETLNDNTYSAGFDSQSLMSYGTMTFSNGDGEVLSYLFSDVGGGEDWFYLLKEISVAHKCDELYCSDFPLECINDGYLTLVDGVCGCMCPPGLDPNTGCHGTLTDAVKDKAESGTFEVKYTKLNFDQASDVCQSEGMHLATPKTAEEQTALTEAVNAANANIFWIGMERIDGEWQWVDRTPLGDYSKWASGQPNNWNNEQDCVDFRLPSSGLDGWNDGNCNHERAFICQNTVHTDTTISWPSGQFALPQPTQGCPAGLTQGSRTETGAAAGECVNKNSKAACNYWKKSFGCDDNPTFMHAECALTCEICHTFGNHQSDTYHLSGVTNESKVEHTFCSKVNTADDNTDVTWPAGQYCIYRLGGACPPGFDEGSALFTDEAHSTYTNSQTGFVPDGEFTSSSTKFEFCCTKYGFEKDELVLPRTEPFVLLKSSDDNSQQCHQVKGMHVYEGYTVIKNSGGEPTLSGETPVKTLDSSKNTYKIPYCYYSPTDKDNCGGMIQLSDNNPTVTIQGESGQNLQCDWLIKGPETSRIALKVDEMDVAQYDDGECEDKLTFRYNRLGQTGKTYCGERLEKTISSVNNTLRVTYETFTTGQSSFTATASLVSQDNLCYSLTDRGQSYAGTVDRTRGLKTCIPWAKAAHCPHNPFTDSDMMAGLRDNYCRNPNPADGLRPWCYTDLDGCQRQYCDVCQFESLYDITDYDSCAAMAENGLCENDPKAEEMCAGHCSSAMRTFPEPTLVKETTCSTPNTIADGEIVGATKSSYGVGETVSYTCKDETKSSRKERRCLSNGEWSPLNYVCTECEWGWQHQGAHCYKLYEDGVTHSEAEASCASHGATLAMAKTEADMDFLNSISFWYGTWLDASDAEVEGQWKWGDGSAVEWTRWMSGQPDNYGNEDCVWMTREGEMEDRWCHTDTTSYICMKAENVVDSCADVTDDCVNFYVNDPVSCSSVSDFMHRNCRHTCGLCSPASCSVEAPTANVEKSADTNVETISQGDYVIYSCKSGFVPQSGDAVRGCLADGTMSGHALTCTPDNEVATSSHVLEKTGDWGTKLGQGWAWTGNVPDFVIPKAGKITKWEFFSTNYGQVMFQVWRSTVDETMYELVGQNIAATPNDMVSTLYVPQSDQIYVQQGDLLGIYYLDSSAGVGYSKCDTNTYPGSENLKILTVNDASNSFQAGVIYDFKTETKEVCRIYMFRAIVE